MTCSTAVSPRILFRELHSASTTHTHTHTHTERSSKDLRGRLRHSLIRRLESTSLGYIYVRTPVRPPPPPPAPCTRDGHLSRRNTLAIIIGGRSSGQVKWCGKSYGVSRILFPSSWMSMGSPRKTVGFPRIESGPGCRPPLPFPPTRGLSPSIGGS